MVAGSATGGLVVLVLDLAHDLLDDVLQRENA
jgi:hypothetical protein